MPSIWRGSPKPIAASSSASRWPVSAGKSRAWKNAAFEVPPRISTQATSVGPAGPAARAGESVETAFCMLVSVSAQRSVEHEFFFACLLIFLSIRV
jgi:hypothetical protein